MANGKAVTVDAVRQILSNEVVLGRCQTYAFTVLGMAQLFHADRPCGMWRLPFSR